MVTTRNSREDVVTAAGRLFAERGYHGTSMRDLGRELGLQGSSLYSHVSSKEDLLVEVIERGAERFQASAGRAMAASDDAKQQLRSLISGHIDVVLDHPEEVKTFLDEARSLEAPHREQVIAARDAYEQTFRDVIRRGQADGLYSPDIDPKVTAIFILSILNATERWFDHSGPLGRDDLVAEMTDFIERSMSRRQ